MRIGGVVLCGGRSSRMGTPKAWLPVGKETMLGRTVRVVGEVVSPAVVVAAAGQDVPPLPADIAIIRDTIADCGPLGGLVSGMMALSGSVDAVLLTACDLPFLTGDFVRVLVEAHDRRFPITVPVAGERRHPLSAVYSLTLLPILQARLQAGQLRMMDLLEIVEPRVLPADPRFLGNVNTPAEYAALTGLPGTGS